MHTQISITLHQINEHDAFSNKLKHYWFWNTPCSVKKKARPKVLKVLLITLSPPSFLFQTHA